MTEHDEPESTTSGPRHVDAAEAEQLISEGGLYLLDVRTPQEFTSLGHIPEALLLPVELIAAASAVVPRDDKPVLVYCEHGVRSQHAARVLLRCGYEQVLNLLGGMSTWRGQRAYDAQPIAGPSGWLLENSDLLRGGGHALDVACGRGRHVLTLAAVGWQVRGIDRNAEVIEDLQGVAKRLGLQIDLAVVDLEVGLVDLGNAVYDLIVVTHYLHRPLFPAICDALKSGGILIYETFTTAQAERGHPKNPDFLLKPDELQKLVRPLEILRAYEGERDGQMVAAVVARKPSLGLP